MEQRSDDEQRDEHGLDDQRPVEVGVERAAVKPPLSSVSQSPERIATAIALQPSGRQRRPSARIAVARASPSSCADRGHADEHERDRPADPDGCGEHVEDAKDREHGRSG